MQSARFGVAWIVHQSVPRLLPAAAAATPHEEEAVRESASVLAYALADVLPCKYCRRSYRAFARSANIRQVFDAAAALTRQEHERFYFDVHNRVNAKLNKPVIPLEGMRAAYDARVARTPRAFVGALLEWLHMLSLNYRDVRNSGDSPAQVHSLEIALERVRGAAGSEEGANVGYFWREARRRRVSLGSLVTAYADGVYADEICGGSSGGGSSLPRSQWRKCVWCVFYAAHLARVMTMSGDAPLVQCAAALRAHLWLPRPPAAAPLKKDDPFMTQRGLFDGIYGARRACLPQDECPPRDALYERYESFRAHQCTAGQCKK